MRTFYFEKSIPKILLSKALKTIWPNVIYSRLSPTRFVDLPEQPLSGADWVRVRNRLCGICASDLHLLFLNFDPRVSPGALPGTKTIYLGHELIGEVTEAGSGVTTLKVGDRVILESPEANCLKQEIKRHCRAGRSEPEAHACGSHAGLASGGQLDRPIRPRHGRMERAQATDL